MNKLNQDKLLAMVKNNYEEIAADFSQTRKRPLWEPLLEIAKNTKNDARVLDVGCGNGRLRQAWIGSNISYVGVEPSKKLLDLAKKNEDWQLVNQLFFMGNVLELSSLDLGLFDEVYCIAVIHHLPGKELRRQAVERLLDRVVPGGRLIISVWSMWQSPRFMRLVIKNSLLKIIGQFNLDFGDLVFSGFNQKSSRYYHAYTKFGFKNLVKLKNAKVEALIFDKKNYYAVLRKK